MEFKSKYQNNAQNEQQSLWKTLLCQQYQKNNQDNKITKSKLEDQGSESSGIRNQDLMSLSYDQELFDDNLVEKGLSQEQYQLDCLNFRKIISQINVCFQNQIKCSQNQSGKLYTEQNQHHGEQLPPSNSSNKMPNKKNITKINQTVNVQNHHRQIIQEQINIDQHIFYQQQIRGKFKKNTNVPKFITRIYMKYFYSYVKQKDNESAYQHHKKIKRKLSSRSTNNYCIADVLQLLRNQKDHTQNLRKFNQKIMNKIIQKQVYQEQLDVIHDCYEDIRVEMQIQDFIVKGQNILNKCAIKRHLLEKCQK